MVVLFITLIAFPSVAFTYGTRDIFNKKFPT